MDTLEEAIKERQFKEYSVSVGEGEDNISVMPDHFRERHDLEQYFYTRDCISSLIQCLMMTYPNQEDLEKKVCLICAPTLAKVLYEEWDMKVTVLDIDDRFKDLPGF